MPSNRDPDDPTRSERTPFNIQADFRETDRSFRIKLGAMLPNELSDRVNEIISARFPDVEKEQEAI